MRFNERLSLVCGLIFVICANSAWGDDQAKIQGEWKVVKFVVNGEPVPEDKWQGMSIQFAGERMSMLAPNVDREYTFKLDPNQTPKAIDTNPLEGPYKGKSGPGIYELEGDSLRLCLPNTATSERPKEFKSPTGAMIGLLELVRAGGK